MHPKNLNFESKKYEDWVREQACIVCGRHGVDCHHVWHGRNNSYLSLPLCREHHTISPDSYHRLEWRKFEEKHNLDLSWEIINSLSKYINETALE